MLIKPVIKGLITNIPGIYSIFKKNKTGQNLSSSYCYNVWIKHLTILKKNNFYNMPNTVVEFGPGNSIGIGLAALLCGAKEYIAIDVVNRYDKKLNLEILDELIVMFKKKKGVDKIGWPNYKNELDENNFPSSILSDSYLNKCLDKKRIQNIKDALLQGDNDKIKIHYISNNDNYSHIKADLIISHSVLEHVEDLDVTYDIFNKILINGGYMSHQIDFKCHNLFNKWNGHWSISDFLWKIILGKRPFLINRSPVSIHVKYQNKYNFKIVELLKNYRYDGISRKKLSSKWKKISDDDFNCCGAFIQSNKS